MSSTGFSGLTCPTPQTSVLFDGEVPVLSRLDGNMWASQLLTAQTRRPSVLIVFDFTATAGYTGVEGMEVVMFNCPEWGIRVNQIALLEAASMSELGMQVSETIITNNTSCNSLVRVCMALSRRVTLPVLNVKFSFPSNNSGDWVHLAEVIFHENHPPNLTTCSNEETGAPQNESSVATAVAVSCVLVVLLLIACVLAVVVVAWGCSKYRKHKVTHKTPPVIDLMA